jgi:ribosome-associated protein
MHIMDTNTLQRLIFDALEDVKAQDIRVFDTMGLTDLFDRVFIASGTSNRQTRALASHVAAKVKEAGGIIIATEGEETGEWVLVDAGDAVVHIMQPAIRQYYNLEELWGAKPIDMKALEKPKATIAKPSKKLATKKAATKKAAEVQAVTKSPATKKPAAKKPAAKKPATKKPAAKKPAAKKPAATKVAK